MSTEYNLDFSDWDAGILCTSIDEQIGVFLANPLVKDGYIKCVVEEFPESNTTTFYSAEYYLHNDIPSLNIEIGSSYNEYGQIRESRAKHQLINTGYWYVINVYDDIDLHIIDHCLRKINE